MRKGKKNKNRISYKEILPTIGKSAHFMDNAKNRFGMDYKAADEFDLSRCKIGNASCPFTVVRSKIAQGQTDFIYLFNTAYNMVIPVDLNTKLATTILYLDGKKGYDYKN